MKICKREKGETAGNGNRKRRKASILSLCFQTFGLSPSGPDRWGPTVGRQQQRRKKKKTKAEDCKEAFHFESVIRDSDPLRPSGPYCLDPAIRHINYKVKCFAFRYSSNDALCCFKPKMRNPKFNCVTKSHHT